jgi:hypothetical protein
MVGTNYWVMQDEPEFASWGAKFPLGKMNDPWEMLSFLQQVLKAAEMEEVFHLVKAPWQKGDLDLYQNLEYRARTDGPTYSQYLEQILAETGKLIFFRQLFSMPDLLPEYRVVAPARLSYYDINGELRDEEVEDVGELLRQVRPTQDDLLNHWPELSEEEIKRKKKFIDKSYKGGGSAIFFGGNFVPKDSESDYGSHLYINLFTDIWFPKVGGFLEEQPVWYEDRVFYDNRELALRHTPRLNRFLANVRDITLEMGGTWYVDKDGYPTSRYEEQFNEDGIILDI